MILRRQAKLVMSPGNESERAYPFVDRIEIGRAVETASGWTGGVALGDPEVSSRHCVVSQTSDGRFLVRDVSLNGTHLDGKRLMPNQEVEIEPGQTLSIGPYALVLDAEELAQGAASGSRDRTVVSDNVVTATVLVGDIRGFSSLTQQEDPGRVTKAVREVFSQLEELIAEHGGALEGFPGDAVLAFWELTLDAPGDGVARALDAALALDLRVREIAENSALWPFPNSLLGMDFALATGDIAISSFGKERPVGLALVGDSVNLAFRMEKLAEDRTGTILACSSSYRLAAERFEFECLGEFEVAGRAGGERIYALRGAK